MRLENILVGQKSRTISRKIEKTKRPKYVTLYIPRKKIGQALRAQGGCLGTGSR